MDSARWEQLQTLFHHATALPESERRAFVEAACAGDSEMLAEVLTMLRADSRDTSLLDRGLSEVAYRTVGAGPNSISVREVGPYRLKKLLGEGGMGVVWLAGRTDAGNLVAIKFLPHAGLSPARRERFALEIKTLARLKHPFIARLYDAGTLDDGTPWFVMEYVEGVPLMEYCRGAKPPVEGVLRLFRSVCEAVQYAHGQEIIHRDLKPSNILVERDGTPRLLDFGIARQLQGLDEPTAQTRQALRFFSPDYAAPEWIRDGTVGFYTDVYSLGVILYEMLTGRLPSDRSKSEPEGVEGLVAADHFEKPSAVARRLAAAPGDGSVVPSLSKSAWGDLDVLCLKAMHRDTAQRYPSVEGLIRDVDHYLKGEPLEARPDTFRYRLGKFVGRNRGSVLATAAVLILVFGLIVFFSVRLARARDAALAEASRTQRVERFMENLFQGGDKEAGPADDLRVVTLLDRGVANADALARDPSIQAELYKTLGTVYESLGKLDRADSLLNLAQQRSESVFGADSAEVAQDLLAIGLLRIDQARYADAERLIRQALEIDKRHLARNDPAVARATAALGRVFEKQGHYDRAVEVLNEAVRLQSADGAPETDLAMTLSALADTDFDLGRYSTVELLQHRILEIHRRMYGGRHPEVADDYMDLGHIQML